MGTRQFTSFLLLVLGLMVVGSALAAGPAVDTPQVNESTNESGTFGEQVSSFMQSSAADAESSSERGMWRAEVNSTENATETVTERVQSLERRLDRLENRSARLENKRGTIPDVAYNAQASALRTQIQNVRAAINETGTVAQNRGVNVTKLNDLRKRAGNATGPEISAAARNITDAPRGPPEGVPGQGPGADTPDRGPPENRTEAPPGKQTPENGNNATDRNNPNDNRTRGPPDDRTERPPVTPDPDRQPNNTTRANTLDGDRLVLVRDSQ